MAGLLTNTITIYSLSITNDGGIEKETKTSLGSFPCRVSRYKSKWNERNRVEISVLDNMLAVYTVATCPVEKDQKAVVDGIEYSVLSVHKHHGYAGVDHIYLELRRII